MHCEYHAAVADIPAQLWDGLFGGGNPFIRHAFLKALEESGCVGPQRGWQPLHLTLADGGRLLAAMPLYAKLHSYGEFVFDWGWAEAYARHGLDYYPKLLTAVPFSPVAGPRIAVSPELSDSVGAAALIEAVQGLAASHSYSGWHLLFPDRRSRETLSGVSGEGRLLAREAVQFQWFNRGYDSFDGFLATLRSARRKNMRRERRLVQEQGLAIRRKTGAEITDEEWHGFYRCYRNTYRRRSGHDGYLNRDFFERLRASMGGQLLLAVARRERQIVACSLFLFDDRSLYGRYWGSLEEVSCLHFEMCYYQGIEFCIDRGLDAFDPGTQGEHKLMRGFEPVKSFSYHWIADARFSAAIAEFLHSERRGTETYQRRVEAYLPYRKSDS